MGFGPVVIPLDLRAGAAQLDTAQALRARVARRLAQAGQPEPEDPLFLVTDTPAGLTDHQRQYELLAAYRAVGKVRILVLLVGSAPGSYAGEDEAFRLAKASEEAVEEIGAFCEREGVDAHFHQGGWLWTATAPAQGA